ncbi:transportin MOS14 [Herrania umbratica]|uniref:Transportin MOS14 n=1 Tax=Herrania umbratica TaxID=108875 RepID=A0A6J1B022_9ROSI|nr:transportin MOS14 [Herrania umbratica]
MQSMELQSTVKEALNALYHHPDDAVRMQADRWLQDFQRTIDAWQVADNLLHDATSNLETLIFCSQTLRSKVQRDFEELPSEAFRQLRDSLNNLLKRFHKGPPIVRTQISIAVAALAVHVPAEDWGDGGIVNSLRDEMNSHPEYIPGFLELLTVLPEEAFNYKIAARPERRRHFEKELTSQMDIALNILTACLNISELKEQVGAFLILLLPFCSFDETLTGSVVMLAVADVLSDAASVLGGDATLQILYMKLVEAISCCGNEHSEWRPAEAALFCIRAISNYVSVVEANVMPQVMDLLSKLPHQAQLLQTVCLIIGAYSKWLDAAPSGFSKLPLVIDILMSGMRNSEDSAAAAALAFRHICDDCRKKLCAYCKQLFHIYYTAVNGEGSFKGSAEDSLHLVEALSMVITELPPESAKDALEELCSSVVTPLQEVINQGPGVLEKKHARELTVHIDRFAYIFRYVNHPGAVADAIHRLWPIFKALFDLRAWDMRTMESLCRACKYAVRTSGRFMGITIGAILEEIQGLYQQHHQPCFLYLSSEVIKIFGSDPSCASYLKNMIEALFKHTTCLLTNIKEFTTRPDIADDCFLLASRCIRYCPQLFFPSAVFPALVDCSMIGITVQHREASNSVLTFLSDIFDLAKSSKGEQFLSIRDSVIIPRGASITRILVAALTGALPSSRLETVAYALLALTRAYGMQALEWAKESVSLIPLTAVKEVERSRFLQALSDAASGADVNALMVPVEELSDVCRRNRTVQEIVQGALKPLELNMLPVS